MAVSFIVVHLALYTGHLAHRALDRFILEGPNSVLTIPENWL